MKQATVYLDCGILGEEVECLCDLEWTRPEPDVDWPGGYRVTKATMMPLAGDPYDITKMMECNERLSRKVYKLVDEETKVDEPELDYRDLITAPIRSVIGR